MKAVSIFTSVLIILPRFQTSSCKAKAPPPIFDMENYTKCLEHPGYFYCFANIEINQENNEQHCQYNCRSYNRSKIHRGLCIPSHLKKEEKKIYVQDKLKEKLEFHQFSLMVFSLDCKRDVRMFPTLQKPMLICLVIYLVVVVYATFTNIPQGKLGTKSWCNYFSMIENFQRLTRGKNSDYQKLISMQGIRTYHTLVVICCHSVMSWVNVYIKNTHYMEELYQSMDIRLVMSYFMIIVQPFFVMSSWLLTNQILELQRKNGQFTVRDMGVLLLNRMARFWPALFVMIFGMMTLLSSYYNGPLTSELMNVIGDTCTKNWWATVFQVTNFISYNQICNLGMWSLSMDTQYYVLNMIILYLILLNRWSFMKVLMICLVYFYITNVQMFYLNRFPALHLFSLEDTKRSNFFQNLTFEQSYFGFSVNWGSSLVGVLFGYLYFNRKNACEVELWERFLMPVFFVLPGIVVFLGVVQFSWIQAAIIGPILKPLYGFSIACGIYVMSRGILRGFVKGIFVNKLVVLLGHFTFSTYIFHIGVVFSKHADSDQLIEIDKIAIVKSFIMDIIQSFALGICLAVLVEQPGINLKKLLLPQVKCSEKM